MINPINLSEIKEAIKSKNLIVFVGAGLSINLGLPDWKQLVLKIITQLSITYPELSTLEGPLKADILSPLQTLTLIEKKHKPFIYKIINETINNIPSGLDYNLHKKIASISEKIITTNYDKFLELANPSLKLISHKSAFSIASIHNYENYIFKIHGSIDNIEDCIVFESQYENYYNSSNPSIFELKKLFSEKTFLFIGFSMKDPYIVEIFNFMENLYDNNINKHYIVTTNPSQYNNFNYLEPIVIDNNNNLETYLDEIIEFSNSNDFTSFRRVAINAQSISNEKTKIIILYPLPIDKDINFNIDLITDCFSNFEVELTYLHFNVENLNKIIDYDYVIIFSQLIKNKLLIEDEYIKSKNIDIDDLQEYYGKSIKGIFLFYTGEVL